MPAAAPSAHRLTGGIIAHTNEQPSEAGGQSGWLFASLQPDHVSVYDFRKAHVHERGTKAREAEGTWVGTQGPRTGWSRDTWLDIHEHASTHAVELTQPSIIRWRPEPLLRLEILPIKTAKNKIGASGFHLGTNRLVKNLQLLSFLGEVGGHLLHLPRQL